MPLQPRPDLFADAVQLLLQAQPVVDVLGEGRLGAQRLADPIRRDGPVVDPPRITVVGVARLSELVHERRLLPLPQVRSRADPQAVHPLGRHRPNPEKAFDGKRRHERLDLGRGDGEQSVGFAVIRGYFRQHLVHRDARRSREVRLGEDPRLDLPGYERRRTHVRDIQKGLVQRQRLDQIRIFAEDGADLLRNGLVDLETRRNEDQIGAQPSGDGRRKRRMHAVGAGFVAGRSHHAPRSVVSHGDRTSPQRRVVALLHRGKEGVHVDMYDLARRHRRFRFILLQVIAAGQAEKRVIGDRSRNYRAICRPIHAISTSTTYACSASVSGRPAGMPCHLARHPRQQHPVACCATKTGCPRIGVWRPSLGGKAGASRCRTKSPACCRIVARPFAAI